MDSRGHPSRRALGRAPQDEVGDNVRRMRIGRRAAYFSLIGGATFSAGAGGNADAAPVVCAGASG
jgi:hypothetical protein